MERMRFDYERKEPLPELFKVLEEISEKLKKENIPITKDGRIDCEAYREFYGNNKVSTDLEEVKKINKKDHPGKTAAEIDALKKERTGEHLEMLKTVIFNKFMGDRYVIVRTAVCDDYLKSVDNIFMDRKTGEAICAFDEVAAVKGEEFEEKKEKILKINKSQGGSFIDYGLKIENGEIKKGRMDFVPLFYIAVSKDIVNKALNGMDMSLKGISKIETQLFSYICVLLKSQIIQFRMQGNLNKEFYDKIQTFEKAMIDTIRENNIKI